MRILLSLVLFKFSSEWSVIIYHLNIAKKKKLKKLSEIQRNKQKELGKNNAEKIIHQVLKRPEDDFIFSSL